MSNSPTTTENKLDRILEEITSLRDQITLLTAGKAPKRRNLVGLVDIPKDRREVVRDAELLRIFSRLATLSAPLKAKNNISPFVIQEIGSRPWEIVPQSILVNRCELLKAFWPSRTDETAPTPRAVVLETLERALEAGELVRSKLADIFAGTRHDKVGELVVILSPLEARRWKCGGLDPDFARCAEDEDEEEVPRPKLQWPTPAPRATEPEDEDEEIPVAPATPRPAKTPPGKPRFFTDDDEGIETGAAPAPHKKVPAFITDQETGEDIPVQGSWSIGGDDDGDE